MMAKFGFKQGDTLGKSEDARRVPIQVSVKEGRSGIGVESEKKRKMREAWDEAAQAAKRSKEEEGDYIEDRRQQQKEKTKERDLDSAQRTAERLFEQEHEDKDGESSEQKPLQDINVLWRRRAKRRLEKEHRSRQRKELDHSLASRLPTRARDEDEDDDDSKVAFGRDLAPFYTSLEGDFDQDQDPELAEFEALPVAERLQKVLVFLRDKYKYCLYCGYQYPDTAMDGCPGVTEEDHD